MKVSTLRLFIVTTIVVALSPWQSRAQGRIILNGGRVNITNGGVVVVANSANNAITRNSGHFISEGENNRIKWNIGTATGVRTIPFGTSSGNYIPVTFTPSAATGATGYFYFATYATAAQNSLNLPTGVTNFNSGVGIDASLSAVDRFWRIEALSYTVRPTLSNLVFTYLDAEFASPNRTSLENKLTARRWNSFFSTWNDYTEAGTVNTTNNTVTIASLAAGNLFPWWSIQYPGAAYHWISSTTGNYNTAANWSATAGGAPGSSTPSFGDAVFFDDVRDGNAVINTAVNAGSITVASGYAGTITQGANTIDIEADANFGSGVFSGGTAAITVNNNLNITGTAFTASSGVVNVKGNMTVSGTGSFIHNNGTVRFSGVSGVQTINAPSTTFRSIDVTNNSASPGLIMAGNNQLTGVLTLGNNVVIDPDGVANDKVFTLLSSADSPTADAAIGILPAGAAVDGRVTIQRHMTIEGANGGRIYRYIASPIAAATVADIQSEIPVTGSFTGTSTCTGCNTAQSMFAYNENIVTDVNKNGVADFDDGYVDFPQTSNLETLTPGVGYAMFVRGNVLGSARWDVRGNINAANNASLSFPVSYTSSGTPANDGWNLVGNPFPSTIDWNAASGWTKTNVTGSIYIRDNAASGGQYGTWNGVVGTNGGSRYIAMGQAFWIKASAPTPLLSADENVKAPGTQTIFFREETPANLLRITLRQDNKRDEAVIHFRPDATNDFDSNADALKLPNGGFNLSTQIPGKEKLAINSLRQSTCSTSLNLLAENTGSGNYNLDFEGFTTFLPTTIIELHDNYLNRMVKIGDGTSYSFAVTADPMSANKNRFTLSIIQQETPMDFTVDAPPVCEGTDAVVVIGKSSPFNMYRVSVNDSTLSEVAGNGDALAANIPSVILQGNANTIKVLATPTAGCASPSEKIAELTVDKRVAPGEVISGSTCNEGVVTLRASGATEAQHYAWYASENSNNVLGTGENFTTPVISKSVTYFVSIVNALGCEGDRLPAKASVVQFENPVITFSDQVLLVDYPGKKQWFLNGETLTHDTLAYIVPDASGIYTVKIPVQKTCEAIASYTYVKPEITTGTDDATDYALHFYPNPVKRLLYFRQENSLVKSMIVQNASGQVVGTIPVEKTGNLTTARFDMSSLSSGMYFIQLLGDQVTKRVKVVKQ